MSHPDSLTFSPMRAFFWPVRSTELKKFLPLFFMAFFIGFNYNVLRNLKDALLITAASSGAEVIPFIKVWGILPGAVLMTFLYSRLNNRFHREQVFYSMVGLFLAFFAFFTFVLYPLRDSLHPHATADFLATYLPTGFKGLIAMFRYWTFSSFYIMSELWSSAVLSMLFWGFTNEITRLGEAKRFYSLIAIGLNFAAVNAGQVSVFLTGSYLRTHLHLLQDEWQQTVVLLTVVVLASGLIVLGLYRYLTHHVLSKTDSDYVHPTKREKIKLSMRENFAYLARSRYLMSIAIIVLSYNIVINLVEVIWKDQVRQLYPDPNAFTAYMGQITSITGAISMLLSFLVSGHMIRKYGWTISAVFTPLVLLVTSACFFFFFFGGQYMLGLLATFGTSPLALVVFFGSAQNCLSRASKFTLYDATKEMAFIPLSLESKLKGKAAIDGVGSRLGKSAGSFIHQALLLIFSTISASAHIVAAILLGVITYWIWNVLTLGRQFQAIETPESEDLAISKVADQPRAETEVASVASLS